MTGVAIIGGGDVACRFTGRSKTIVTTDAGTLNFIVVGAYRWHPGRADVTGLANVRGVDVRHTFARCQSAIVTGNTGFRRGAVIKHRHQPVGSDVASVARGRGRNMCRRFASGNDRVMTACASAGDLSVIHQWVHW